MEPIVTRSFCHVFFKVASDLVAAGTLNEVFDILSRAFHEYIGDLSIALIIQNTYEGTTDTFISGFEDKEKINQILRNILTDSKETSDNEYHNRHEIENGIIGAYYAKFENPEIKELFKNMAPDISNYLWNVIVDKYNKLKENEAAQILWKIKDVQAGDENELNNITLNKLLENLLVLALRRTSANIGAIVLLNENTNELEFEPRAMKGKAIRTPPETMSREVKTICSVVLKTNKFYICNDSEKDSNYFPMFENVFSSLAIPILFQKRTIGVIIVESQKKNFFKIEDVEKLTSLSKTAAMFIRRAQLYKETSARGNGIRIVGTSSSWRNVEKRVEKAAATDATVLLRGESGTGKELIAHSIHFNSQRKTAPFITVNCAAIPGELLESEMFGHVKGAFTGAINDKIGEFQKADGGTIFLDEIGDLPLLLQVKLLRVLQSGEVRPVGSNNKPVRVNVRVIAATSRNLEEMIEQRVFRRDMYYRLNVVPIWLPPLREHKEDIAQLIQNFIEEANQMHGTSVRGVTKAALDVFMTYDYPGNVRQLSNFIHQSIIMSDGNTIKFVDIPEELRNNSGSEFSPNLLYEAEDEENPGTYHDEKEKIMESFSRNYFSALLEKTGGNIQDASKIAGISRTAFYKIMERYSLNINPKEF